MPPDPSAVKALFLEAAATEDPAARAALLHARCGADAELLARVGALLASHDREAAHTPPEPLPGAAGRDGADPMAHVPGRDERVGAVIAGRYKLVEEIGAGGMATVYLAQQTEPVRRAVAVKVIKAGMDSKNVLARFDAERQALAMMDHLNIARVLDAGATAGGRPFFVMELVKGVPITEFCDARRLTARERLELFVPVCHAIQHAHQKGVIHRDIKPSNVLVALYDDRPVPKVIDFGIATATGQPLTEHTIDTGFGVVVGTPQYMSPEQATFNNLDIDTRSDVYSLGVLLYELLAGSPPFAKKELERRGLLEILRVVREDEPPRPSAKLSTADALPSISASRGTEPRALTGLLRNELDWIVMKALEKDRGRRYETANGFAADVNRYLSGEAVLAHPPSTAYRARKFIRRHKGQVLAAGLLLVALLAGMAGTTAGLIEAKKQERLAVTAQAAEAERAEGELSAKLDAQGKEKLAAAAAERERLARIEAQRQQLSAEAITRFVYDDFLLLTSVVGQDRIRDAAKDALGKDTTLGQLLDRAADKLKARRDLDPLIEAELCSIVGVSYRRTGDARRAIPFLERSVKLRTDRLGRAASETLDSMSNLARCYQESGRPDRALPLFEEALELTRVELGPDDIKTLTLTVALAQCYQASEQPDRALPLLKAALEPLRAKLGHDDPKTLVCMTALAVEYGRAGRRDESLSLLAEILALTRAKLAPDDPETIACVGNLAVGYWQASRLDRSIPLFEEALKLLERKLGRQHPDTLNTIANLGVNYKDAGRLAEAVPLLEEAHRASKKIASLRWAGNQLLDGYQRNGDAAAAGKLVSELLADAREQLPKGSPRLAGQLTQFGMAHLMRRDFAAAEALLRESLAIREAKEPDDWRTFNTQSVLGESLLGQKRYADAEPLLLKAYEGLKQREKAIPPAAAIRIPEALDRLVALYSATGKPAEVKRWRAERAKYPPPTELAPPPRAVK